MTIETLLRSTEQGFIATQRDGQQLIIPKQNTREQLIVRADEADLIGDDLVLELSVSSEEPYLRYYYYEILDHDLKSIDLSRLNNQANFLFNHKRNDYLGVIQKAWIEKGKLYNQYRFSDHELATQVKNDVNAGIITKASIGYQALEMILEKQSEDDYNTYRVTKWLPYESSLCTLPADDTVGVGRSYYLVGGEKSTETKIPTQNTKTTEEITTKSMDGQDGGTTATLEVNENDVRTQERARVQTLYALGDQYRSYGIGEIIEKAVTEGTTIEATRSLVLEKITDGQQPVAKTTDPLGLNGKEQRNYSVCKAILASLDGNWDGAGLEKEVHDALCKRNEKLVGKSSRKSAQIPFFDLMVNSRQANDGYMQLVKSAAMRNVLARSYETRDFFTGIAAQGGNLIETELDSRFIDIFRNTAMVIQAGAQTLTGLIGNLDIPKQLTGQTDGSTTYWVAEGSNVGQLDATFGLLQIRPKTLGAWMITTRLMLLQSTIDIEQFMRRELALNIALGVDRAAITGTGINDEPLGILNTPGVNPITNGADGGAPTWPRMIQYETKIATANADVGSMAWLGNARTRGELKSREKFTGTSGQPIWQDIPNSPGKGTVNGYPFHCTNQVPGDLTKGTGTNLSALVFGKWDELFFAEWGNTEILANPYGDNEYLNGGIRLRILHTCDIGVRHPESFAAATDLGTPISDAA